MPSVSSTRTLRMAQASLPRSEWHTHTTTSGTTERANSRDVGMRQGRLCPPSRRAHAQDGSSVTPMQRVAHLHRKEWRHRAGEYPSRRYAPGSAMPSVSSTRTLKTAQASLLCSERHTRTATSGTP
ncbi:hypothetical protein B0H19DRAFT_1253842 [Mycena capillaripes]|nr:hypothetical protein B0H19DRAFT_1253842 [Mycena capillaripes]